MDSDITRETPALGGISLALRGSSAYGATFGAPPVPIWKTAAFGGSERKEYILGRHGYLTRGDDKKIGEPATPQ